MVRQRERKISPLFYEKVKQTDRGKVKWKTKKKEKKERKEKKSAKDIGETENFCSRDCLLPLHDSPSVFISLLKAFFFHCLLEQIFPFSFPYPFFLPSSLQSHQVSSSKCPSTQNPRDDFKIATTKKKLNFFPYFSLNGIPLVSTTRTK